FDESRVGLLPCRLVVPDEHHILGHFGPPSSSLRAGRSLGEGPVGAGDPRSLTAVRTAGRSGVDDLADLDADPVLETGTAAGQAGGFVGVSGADHDIPRQGRGRRVAVVLAVQGTHRAPPVSPVGDRGAKVGKPGAPLLVLIRLGRAVRLAAESENVLAHDLFPSAGPARFAGLYLFVNRRAP